MKGVFLGDFVDVVEAAGVGLVERVAADAADAGDNNDNSDDVGDDDGVYRRVITSPSSVEICCWSLRRTSLAGPFMFHA